MSTRLTTPTSGTETTRLAASYFEQTGQPGALAQAYEFARGTVVEAGFAWEIAWQDSLRFEDVTESDFLRENAWVVLCCGMRESVVRERFAGVSECFHDWESAQLIASRRRQCRSRALRRFNHPGKIDAIISTAGSIAEEGFRSFKDLLVGDPLQALQSLPFIGPVTCYHLAKNLGIPVAKPDRHLTRLARSTGFADVQDFCKVISSAVDDPIPVVDLVLWRFATIDPGYVESFAAALGPSGPRYPADLR